MRVILLLVLFVGFTGCVPEGEGEGEGEGEPLACEDVGCVVVPAADVSDCAEAAALLETGGKTALSVLGFDAVEFGEGGPPALIGELNCTTCISSPVRVRAARHDLSGASLLEIIGDVTLNENRFSAEVQPAAVNESGSWALQIFDPALFAARVRIACPSFVDVDEVVLGSA